MLRIGQIETTALDGKYTDGNVAGGLSPTRLRAEAFNAIQEELCGIVESAGITLNKDNSSQVLSAIGKLFVSQKNIGSGTGQIPDMSYFTSNLSSPGYQKFPGGFVIQWGTSVVPVAGNVTSNYPLAMISTGYLQLVSPTDVSSTNNYRVGIASSTATSITLTSTNTQSVTGVMWISIGKVNS